MKDGFTVSVVIVARNASMTIGECLDSVLSQSRKPDEIIVVDDGSNDNTVEIVSRFLGVKLLKQNNRGISHARNLGTKRAQGEIVFYMDSDCIAESDWIETMLPYFSDENVGAVAGISKGWNPKEWLACYQALLAEERVRSEPCHPSLVQVASTRNLALRRSAFKELGGFDERLTRSYQEDKDLTFRLSKRHKIMMTPTSIVHHRYTGSFRRFFLRWIRGEIGSGLLYAKHQGEFPEPATSPLISLLFMTSLLIFGISFYISWWFPILLFCVTALVVIAKIVSLYLKVHHICVVLFPLVALLIVLASFAWFYGFLSYYRNSQESQ